MMAAALLLPLVLGGLLLIGGRRADRPARPVAITSLGLLAGLLALLWVDGGKLSLAWLPVSGGWIALSFAATSLTAPAALVLVLVAVAVTAAGIPPHDRRYCGLVLLFVGAVLLVVTAQDLLGLLIGWELASACSFGLIGHRLEDPRAGRAAARAFLTHRVGGLGLYLAVAVAYADLGHLSLTALADSPHAGLILVGLLTAAAAKSAQLPFSGWLSGAMHGPLPASALLHSAALLALGALLLIKVLPLVAAVDWAGPVLVSFGATGALAGALVALGQEDPRQILAASTVSQLGLVFLAVGAQSGIEALTLLLAHAPAKALLFLVLGAGLAASAWPPHLAAGAALLALAALPPAGSSLAAAGLHAAVGAPAAVVVPAVAFLTGMYGFRLLTRLARAGEPHPPHALSLALLALPALGIGWQLAALQGPPSGNRQLLTALPALTGIAIAAALRGRLRAPLALRRWLGLPKLLDGLGAIVFGMARALARFDSLTLAETALAGRTAVAAAAPRLRDLGRPLRARTRRLPLTLPRHASRADARLTGQTQRAARGFTQLGQWIARLHNGLLLRYYALMLGGMGVLLVTALIAFGE